MSNTSYNPWNTDKLYSEMTAEEKQIWGDQVWERHLEETKRLQEKYKPAMIVDNERLRAEIETLRQEVHQWKAAHDNQVKLKQIISDRPDLKERAKLVAELIEERDGWREAAYSLGEAIPASWEELQPPAAQLAKFKEMVKLQQEKYKL